MNDELITFEKTDFDYVNPEARVVIVGITPGKSQLEKSRENLSKKEIKRINAFAGNMRLNLIAMLDHVGINRLLGIESCKSLWEADFDKVEMTSLLKEATFYKGKMFKDTKLISKSPKLQEMLKNGFVKDCISYTKAKLFVALGPNVLDVLNDLKEGGVINVPIIAIPHPSGANAGRVAAFLHPDTAKIIDNSYKWSVEQSNKCIEVLDVLLRVGTSSTVNQPTINTSNNNNDIMIDLIEKYDSLTWIPSFGGALFHNLLNTSEKLMGDVDKYVAVIDSFEDSSPQYYAATSLITFFNGKGRDYISTFRFIFGGTFSTNKKHNCLEGKLCILVEDSKDLSDYETSLIKEIKALSNQIVKYNKTIIYQTETLNELKEEWNSLVSSWNSYYKMMKAIKNDNNYNRVNFFFDVHLSQDGLLLIKYDNTGKFNSYISKDIETANHYRLNNLYVTVMEFIRSTFYNNILFYRFIIPSYLFNSKNLDELVKKQYCSRILNQQLEAFLSPINKMKDVRNNLTPNFIREKYNLAKTLVDVFSQNDLIDNDYKERTLKSLDSQELGYNNKIELYLIGRNAKVEANNNPFNRITVYLAVISIFISTFGLFISVFTFDRLKEIIGPLLKLFAYIPIFILLLFYLLTGFRDKKNKYSDYFEKVRKHDFFYKDSDIEGKKLSFRYRIWVWLCSLPYLTLYRILV